MPKTRASKETLDEEETNDSNSANHSPLSQLTTMVASLHQELTQLRKEVVQIQHQRVAQAHVKEEILGAPNPPISLENATRKAQSDVQDIQLRDGNSPSSDDLSHRTSHFTLNRQ